MTRSWPEPLRRALRELARADAARLIPEARTRARARAAKLIEDELVEELLRAAASARASSSPSEEEQAPAGRTHSPGEAWWTFCVVSADDAERMPPELEGIEPGSSVEIVREADLAALVSAVSAEEYDDVRLREHLEDLAWVERTARRHEAVLEEALGRLTIVPLRLCTLYRDRSGVQRLLREHAEPLRDSLAKVDGCAEWGVKVFAGSLEMGEQPAEGGEPEGAGGAPGATYLVQRQRERQHAELAAGLRAGCAEAVHERVSACALEAISNPPQHPQLHGRDMTMVLNGAYLVAHGQAAELQRAVGALQSEWGPRGFAIELTGPWPAYNFVSGVMP